MEFATFFHPKMLSSHSSKENFEKVNHKIKAGWLFYATGWIFTNFFYANS
jgi:hypothetical protein